MVMATIYTIVGEFELAIDELEYVLSIPAWCTAKYLMADPIFTPLYEIPRFQKVIEKYASK